MVCPLVMFCLNHSGHGIILFVILKWLVQLKQFHPWQESSPLLILRKKIIKIYIIKFYIIILSDIENFKEFYLINVGAGENMIEDYDYYMMLGFLCVC